MGKLKQGLTISLIIVSFVFGLFCGNAVLAPIRFDVEAISAFGSALAGLATSLLAILGVFGYRRVFAEHEIKHELFQARRLLEDVLKLKIDGQAFSLDLVGDLITGEIDLKEISAPGRIPDRQRHYFDELVNLARDAESRARAMEAHLDRPSFLSFPLLKAKIEIHYLPVRICQRVKGKELVEFENTLLSGEPVSILILTPLSECEEKLRSLIKQMQRGERPQGEHVGERRT